MGFFNLFKKKDAEQGKKQPAADPVANAQTKGTLTGYDHSAAENARKIKQAKTEHDIGIQGEEASADAGLIGTSYSAAIKREQAPEARKKADRERDRLMQQVKDLEIWLLEQLALLDEQIRELQERSDEYGRTIDELSLCLEDIQNNNFEEWDDDGYPVDRPKAKAAIVDWEKRNNTKFDPRASNADAILVTLLGEQKDLKQTEDDALDVKRDKQTDLLEKFTTVSDCKAKLNNRQDLTKEDRSSLDKMQAEKQNNENLLAQMQNKAASEIDASTTTPNLRDPSAF